MTTDRQESDMPRQIRAHSGDVFADKDGSGAWRVEWIGSDGECYVAIFAGPSAEIRAREYGGYLTEKTIPDPAYGDEIESSPS